MFILRECGVEQVYKVINSFVRFIHINPFHTSPPLNNFSILFYSHYSLTPTQRGEIYIYIYREGESGFNCWGYGSRAYVVLALCECIWNAPAISFVLSIFDDTGSAPGCLPPWVFTLGDYLPFHWGDLGG